MTQISLKSRIKGAITGILIGDALGVGPHWYYDMGKLKQDYGTWIDDYTTPMPNRYHSGLKAGENSQTGQVATFLIESIAEVGAYDESDFTRRLDALLATLDGSPKGGRYTDQAMREVWRARDQGLPWSEAGSYSDTAEAAIRAPILALRYINQFDKAVKNVISNVRLTHRDPFIAGQSAAFALVVSALAKESELSKVAGKIGGWAKKADVSLAVPVSITDSENKEGFGKESSFFDALLQPAWAVEASKSKDIRIEPPHAVCLVHGLACTLGFMLPAAYYLVSRFENDFEMAVLSAINGGGNNMARAALTGALGGAMVGFEAIPERFVSGLAQSERLLPMIESIAEAAENPQDSSG